MQANLTGESQNSIPSTADAEGPTGMTDEQRERLTFLALSSSRATSELLAYVESLIAAEREACMQIAAEHAKDAEAFGRREEREACAKVCEHMATDWDAAERCAAAIRNRA